MGDTTDYINDQGFDEWTEDIIEYNNNKRGKASKKGGSMNGVVNRIVGKYLGESKYYSEFEVDGRKANLKKSNKFTGQLVVGLVYEIDTWQGEGLKTIFINTVKQLGAGESTAVPVHVPQPTVKQTWFKPTSQPTSSKKEPVQDADRMSKADWAKKDSDIKWLNCMKSASEFHARREGSTIDNVIVDAQKLFEAPSVNLGDVCNDVEEEPNPYQGL